MGMNGLRDQKPDFQSGLGNVQARSLEIQKLLKVKRMVVQKKWRKKRKKRRNMMRRKKNKNLKYVLTENYYKMIIRCHCFHTYKNIFGTQYFESLQIAGPFISVQ